MDLMEIRRRMLTSSGKKDYLKGVEWILNKFISATGGIIDSSLLKYTESIPLDAGEYVFSGAIGRENVYTRIHAYNENDKWVRQLGILDINSSTNFSKIISVPSDVYAIRISTGISVVATLTKA